jgi:hypothetical protein
MKPTLAAVVAVVMILAVGTVAYACGPGGCNGSNCSPSGKITWTSYSSPEPSAPYVHCTITISTPTLLMIGASNLAPGTSCEFFAVLTSTVTVPVTLTDSYSDGSTCFDFLYSDNIYQDHPAPALSVGGTFHYQSTIALSPSAGNSCQGATATFSVQITGTQSTLPLVAPTISVSPTTIYSGQSSTLSTTTSFSGGISPYSCEWLVEAPGKVSYIALGGSFSCTAGEEPTVSTGVLSTAGTWHFELEVTDSSPTTVVSNSVSVTVEPKPVTHSVTFSESGLPSGLTWTVTVNGVSMSLKTSGCTNSLTWTGLTSGTYAYTITGISGWHQSTLPYSGNVVVSDASVTEPTLVYTHVTYSVTFTETGLPSGTSWSVTLNGATESSKGSTITFAEPNGTYVFTIGKITGNVATPASASILVNGAAVSVSVTITKS